MTTTFVRTLGDSTLENIYHHLNGEGTNIPQALNDSVEGQLQTKLGGKFQVVSHANDGFTTGNVLSLGTIGRALIAQFGPKFDAYIKAKLSASQSRIPSPLEELTREISKSPKATHYVVISVGGNDFREHLTKNRLKLLTDVPNIQARYLAILNSVQEMGTNVRPILMFQYRPDANNDSYRIYKILGIAGVLTAAVNTVCISIIQSAVFALVTLRIKTLTGTALILIAAVVLAGSCKIVPLKVTKGILTGQKPGMAMLGALMEKYYRPILERAKKDYLPILDLPNSFNPYEKLYISGIEPSKEGGELIATGLNQIIRNSIYETSSRIFLCNGQSSNNDPQNWEVKYT